MENYKYINKQKYESSIEELNYKAKKYLLESDKSDSSYNTIVMSSSDTFDDKNNRWIVFGWYAIEEYQKSKISKTPIVPLAYIDNDTFEVIYISEDAKNSDLIHEEITRRIKILSARK